MNKTKTLLISVITTACLAFSAQALASPEFGRGGAPSDQPVVSLSMSQASPKHPDRMVGGQGMPALGSPFARVTSNASDLRNLHPGYRGFISDGS